MTQRVLRYPDPMAHVVGLPIGLMFTGPMGHTGHHKPLKNSGTYMSLPLTRSYRALRSTPRAVACLL